MPKYAKICEKHKKSLSTYQSSLQWPFKGQALGQKKTPSACKIRKWKKVEDG